MHRSHRTRPKTLRLVAGLLLIPLLLATTHPTPAGGQALPAPSPVVNDQPAVAATSLGAALPPHRPAPAMQVANWQPTLAPDDGSAYNPDHLAPDLAALHTRYPEVAVSQIGTSRDGRPLLVACLGNGPATLQVNAAHHAREHMTVNLALAWLEFYAQAYHEHRPVAGHDVASYLRNQQLCVIPIVNPDGVALVERGAAAIRDPALRRTALAINGGSDDFHAWKANAAGADPNSNYPFRWVEKPSPAGPAPAGYKGPNPLSEPETRAVADFTTSHDTRLVITLHSAGDVLYWWVDEHGQGELQHREWTEAIARLNGYKVMPADPASAEAGMKDWFVGTTGRYGVTMEIGGPNGLAAPVPADRWPDVWHRNWQVPLLLMQLGQGEQP